jgi:hypothetical protein
MAPGHVVCAAKDCVNKRNEGAFVGDFCLPCDRALRSGKAEHGTSWIFALADDLADSRLIAREQEDAHVAANMRATALEADRDQIGLTLAVAKADRDKWFNRARDLEAQIDYIDGHSDYARDAVEQARRKCPTALETK